MIKFSMLKVYVSLSQLSNSSTEESEEFDRLDGPPLPSDSEPESDPSEDPIEDWIELNDLAKDLEPVAQERGPSVFVNSICHQDMV